MISYPLYASPEGRTPFDEYKNEANGVPELNPIEAEVLSCYKKYEDAVNNGIVHTLRPHGFVQPEKGNLQNLYSSDCDVAKKVRSSHNEFTRTERRIYHNKCPYCVLSEPNTLEHILPKGKYPEYAVHAYNLIPCCSKCNSHKGEAILNKDNGLPHTLNLYYHDPDKFEFLQVECSLDSNNQPFFSYKLNFPSNTDPILTTIITNHFNRLHLIERYNEEVIKTYTAIEPIIKSLCSGKNISEALDAISNYFATVTSYYGINHHKIALLRCLISSSQYHTYLNRLL